MDVAMQLRKNAIKRIADRASAQEARFSHDRGASLFLLTDSASGRSEKPVPTLRRASTLWR